MFGHTEGVSASPSPVRVTAGGWGAAGEGPCVLSSSLSRQSHGDVQSGGDFSSAELAGSLAFTRFPGSMESGTREVCWRTERERHFVKDQQLL